MCTHAEGQTPKHYYLFALGSALVLAVNAAVKIIIPASAELLKSVTHVQESCRSCKTFGDKELMAGSSSRSS